MSILAYPPARAVAARVQPYFSCESVVDGQDGDRDARLRPDSQAIEHVVNAAFWASLRRVEGYVPTISLALLPPEQAERPMRFERSLPLDAEALADLAPAVERPGIHLGVWREHGELRVWGTTRTVPVLCFVLEVMAPGLLVIKHRHRQDSGKFVNVAVLDGDQVKIIAPIPENPSDHGIPASLIGLDSTTHTPDVFVELATSMRAHRHGGSLLVVPAGSTAWRESIVQPIRYSVSPGFSDLAALVRQERVSENPRTWEEALRRSVEAVAGLTAVDGATVITRACDVLAFGVKIARRQDRPRVEHAVVTEPIQGASRAVVNATQLGGTRHLSAAQFAQDQPDAFALVASQDGRFTVFSWSRDDRAVHAHRVETLLL